MRERVTQPRRWRWLVTLTMAAAVAAHADTGDEPPDLSPLPLLDPYDAGAAYPDTAVFAPRVFPGAKRAQDRDPADAEAAQPGMLQGGGLRAWPRLFRGEALSVTGSVSGTAAALKLWNNAFAPPPSLQTAGAPVNPGWGEYFVEAGLTASWTLTSALKATGGASYLETGTRGRDYDGNANINHGDTELLYAGVSVEHARLRIDATYGQQEYTIGDGMLLWAGATNGTQRGADYLGPRTAWARAGLVKLQVRDLVTAEFFDLAPNEAPAAETGTRLRGVNVEWAGRGPLRAGATWIEVPRSEIVTRDGLDVLDLRLRWHPFAQAPAFWLQGEYAYEHSERTRANGWYVQANYNAQAWPWKPLLALQWTRLSGDDPATTRWEGFDPLYFGNDNPNWYPGKIASMFLDNTNVAIASANLTLAPSEQQVLELWVLAFRAVNANAPLAIPEPNAAPPMGGGVPSKPLLTEIDAAWTLKFGKDMNVSLVGAWATPGRGYRDLYAAAGGAARAAWLVGTQFNVSF